MSELTDTMRSNADELDRIGMGNVSGILEKLAHQLRGAALSIDALECQLIQARADNISQGASLGARAETAERELVQARTDNERLKVGLRDIQDIHDQDSCQCTDPPKGADEDDSGPQGHADYCPVYLSDYIERLLEVKTDPVAKQAGQDDRGGEGEETMISGNFVQTFAAASHGLVVGISLDAQWEHAILPILSLSGMILQFRDYPKQSIIHSRDGQEFTFIHNQCPMDRASNKQPSIHKVLPFKDEHAKAAEAAEETKGE